MEPPHYFWGTLYRTNRTNIQNRYNEHVSNQAKQLINKNYKPESIDKKCASTKYDHHEACPVQQNPHRNASTNHQQIKFQPATRPVTIITFTTEPEYSPAPQHSHKENTRKLKLPSTTSYHHSGGKSLNSFQLLTDSQSQIEKTNFSIRMKWDSNEIHLFSYNRWFLSLQKYTVSEI